MLAWLCATGAIACSGADSGGGPSDAASDTTATDGGAQDGARTDAAPDGGASGSDAADAGDAADAATADSSSTDSGPDAPVDAGPPSLVALAVSAPASPDASVVTLVPAFSPDVHDYTVRCGAGSNVLTVSMTASAGSESLLVQPIASPTLPTQTLSLDVAEGQAVVAAATNGTATVEYWVRCLPHDFPQLAWTPHPQAGAAPPGYYLVGTALPTASGCYAMVLDGNGVPVWYTPSQATFGWCVFDVDTLVPGTISFDSLIDNPTQFELHGLSPITTTRIAPKGLNTDLHELRVLPGGDYLVISTPLQQGVDVTGMQVPLPDGGVETLSGPQTIMACNLVELQPDGTVVWTWSATDHFDAVADSVAPELAPYGPAGTTIVLDPFHCNSIDVDPTSGNLLVSAREMASVFEVERATGRVLWKMGGATASKDGATYVSVADPFALQHDARFQPDWASTCNGGSGHISLFDDEVTGAAAPARAVVYDVVVGEGDGGADAGAACGDAGAAVVSWQRAGSGPSRAMGSFRILPDGSRVIGWGLVPGQGFTEVDLAGDDLVDLTFPDGNTTYRAIKVPTSALDLGVLRSTAGLP
jgi:hypothetical protein